MRMGVFQVGDILVDDKLDEEKAHSPDVARAVPTRGTMDAEAEG